MKTTVEIPKHQEKPKPIDLTVTTFEGNGLQSGFSWDNASEIREMIYEGRGGLSSYGVNARNNKGNAV